MKTKSIASFFLILLSLFNLEAGAPDQVASFSSFEAGAIQNLKPGDILAAKGSLMSFERGISSETCFIASAPQDKVSDRIAFWDQTPYSDLGVFIQGKISAAGDPDFSKLVFNPSLRSMTKFMDKTRDVHPNDGNLHLSGAEISKIMEKKGSMDAAAMNRVWTDLLTQRFKSYQAEGLKGLASYDSPKGKIDVSRDVDSLLSELPRVSKRFGSLFEQVKSHPNDGQHYWQLEDVDGTGDLVLGTVYKTTLPDGGIQMIDLQWYVSNGYYTAFTCYEIHALDSGKTLVWRGDYTSISMKQLRKGVERMFSVNIMIQEVKKSIRFFLEDLGKK